MNFNDIKRAIRLDRENPLLHLQLAREAERLGLTADAVAALKRAWMLAPSDETARAELARVLDWKNRAEESRALVEKFRASETAVPSGAGVGRGLLDKIVEISHPDAIGPLLKVALAPGRPAWYRREAVLSVGRMRMPPAAIALIEADNADDAPHDILLDAIAETGSPWGLEKLIRALDDPVPQIKAWRCFLGIGRVKTASARRFLLERYAEKRPSEIPHILYAIGLCPQDSDAAIALRHINSESEKERAAAVGLMAAVGLPELHRSIIGRLDDESPEVVDAAARGVELLELKGALPRLRRLVAHWNEAIKLSVFKALGTVGEEEDIAKLEASAKEYAHGPVAAAAREAARQIRIRLERDARNT